VGASKLDQCVLKAEMPELQLIDPTNLPIDCSSKADILTRDQFARKRWQNVLGIGRHDDFEMTVEPCIDEGVADDRCGLVIIDNDLNFAIGLSVLEPDGYRCVR